MERYEACSPLRPHFCLRCTKKPVAKQKVAMQAGRQTVTYRRQSGEGQTGNGQTQQPDRRWAYRQWWTSEGQTDNSRQAGPDKRLPDGRRQRPDRKVDSRSRWGGPVYRKQAAASAQPADYTDMFGPSPYMALTAKKTGEYSNIGINQSVSMPQPPNGR